jgi:N-acetylneuraminate synthase
MEAGELLTAECVRIIRPGTGLPPKELDKVLGRRLKVRVPRGTPLSWDIVT